MNDKGLIENIRDRPGMYGLDGTYYPTAMLVLGIDLGTSGRLLDGFREWLLARKGEESSFMWMLLVLEDAFPGTGIHHWKSLTENQQQPAVDHLFALLIEFLTEREAD
ncbi:hypothetical protein GCM10022403_090680 [Streptomyces coacervatus]|uniref:Uncharacterized protein n=1 Tax=Streptomyces coacervatus TaxID=647381 RepID=A0ABP7JHL4_9ACTN|nr:hypothetical protein [Streptomyces coacervatus]MDF2271091.1 hypothetical protein [Streptomyces coacervatus]